MSIRSNSYLALRFKEVVCMANRKGVAEKNKMALVMSLGKAYKNELLTFNNNVITLYDESNNKIVSMDAETGNWIGSNAGKNKGNRRAYFAIPVDTDKKVMECPNYTFKILSLCLTRRTKSDVEKCLKYLDEDKNMVINHINGDTLDNTDSNLEVVTVRENNAHGAYMKNVNEHYPDIVEKVGDSYRWTDRIGVSCEEINDWNEWHKDDPIVTIVNRNGKYNHTHDKDYITESLKYFNKI